MVRYVERRAVGWQASMEGRPQNKGLFHFTNTACVAMGAFWLGFVAAMATNLAVRSDRCWRTVINSITNTHITVLCR